MNVYQFIQKKTKFRLLFKAIADLLQTDITDKADFLSLKDFLLDQSHISHMCHNDNDMRLVKYCYC